MSDLNAPASSPMINGTDNSSHEPMHLHISVRGYLTIFAILMALLVITVAAAFLPHMGYLNIGIAMLIAMIKATLVVLYFMHLRFSSRLTSVFVVSMLVWLAILFALTFNDYFTRPWDGMSRGWNDNPVMMNQPSPDHSSESSH